MMIVPYRKNLPYSYWLATRSLLHLRWDTSKTDRDTLNRSVIPARQPCCLSVPPVWGQWLCVPPFRVVCLFERCKLLFGWLCSRSLYSKTDANRDCKSWDKISSLKNDSGRIKMPLNFKGLGENIFWKNFEKNLCGLSVQNLLLYV